MNESTEAGFDDLTAEIRDTAMRLLDRRQEALTRVKAHYEKLVREEQAKLDQTNEKLENDKKLQNEKEFQKQHQVAEFLSHLQKSLEDIASLEFMLSCTDRSILEKNMQRMEEECVALELLLKERKAYQELLQKRSRLPQEVLTLLRILEDKALLSAEHEHRARHHHHHSLQPTGPYPLPPGVNDDIT